MKHRLRLWWEVKVSKLLTPEDMRCVDCGLGRSRWKLVTCKDLGSHRWFGGEMCGRMEAKWRQ